MNRVDSTRVYRTRTYFWGRAGDIRLYRKRPHRSLAYRTICRRFVGTRVRWSGDVSGARPRHVRVRVVSRFSALQKGAETLKCKWRQMQAFSAGSVSEWCGRARLLLGSCRSNRSAAGRLPAEPRQEARQQPRGGGTATASRRGSNCLEAERFLPRQTVPGFLRSCHTVPASPNGSARQTVPSKPFLPRQTVPGLWPNACCDPVAAAEFQGPPEPLRMAGK